MVHVEQLGTAPVGFGVGGTPAWVRQATTLSIEVRLFNNALYPEKSRSFWKSYAEKSDINYFPELICPFINCRALKAEVQGY